MDKGNYEGALQVFLACPSRAYLIALLGKDYPRAWDELRRLRDESEAKLDPLTIGEEFHLWEGFNRSLDDQEHAAKVVLIWWEKYPDLRQELLSSQLEEIGVSRLNGFLLREQDLARRLLDQYEAKILGTKGDEQAGRLVAFTGRFVIYAFAMLENGEVAEGQAWMNRLSGLHHAVLGAPLSSICETFSSEVSFYGRGVVDKERLSSALKKLDCSQAEAR